MAKIKVDLEELALSFGFNDDELASEYFNRETGEIINIPRNTMKVAEGDMDEQHLSDWESELLSDAEAILEDDEDHYLLIPNIEDSFFCNLMSKFTEEAIIDDLIKGKLMKSLNSGYPMREFKRALSDYSEVQDSWYEYEDKKTKEYITKWLRNNDIDFEEI